MSVTKTAKTDKYKSRNKPRSNSKIVTKTSNLKKFKTLAKENKFIVALILIVILLLGALINQKYQDWDNAQMIKGLARDFPALVDEIEHATGLDLEVKYDCMQTQEKFTEGVVSCELLFFGVNESDNDAKEVFEVISAGTSFKKDKEFENKEGYKFLYRNKKSCSFTSIVDIYGSCVIGVRDTNFDLAKELFVYSE
jgi:hypothetical protein